MTPRFAHLQSLSIVCNKFNRFSILCGHFPFCNYQSNMHNCDKTQQMTTSTTTTTTTTTTTIPTETTTTTVSETDISNGCCMRYNQRVWDDTIHNVCMLFKTKGICDKMMECTFYNPCITKQPTTVTPTNIPTNIPTTTTLKPTTKQPTTNKPTVTTKKPTNKPSNSPTSAPSFDPS